MSLPLTVRQHQQDTFDSCGRACAQMVIGFEFARLGLPNSTPLPDQTTAMASAEVGMLANWATEPADLAAHINRGLQALPNAKIWKVLECKPAPGLTGDAANAQVAYVMYDQVMRKLNAGFPSVLLIDSNDHWETAYNWGIEEVPDPTGAPIYVSALYTVNPSPALVSPLGTAHSGLDTCSWREHTIRFLNFISARTMVCDAAPFVGSAIGIIQTNPSDGWSGGSVVRRDLSELPAENPPPDPRFLGVWKERAALNEFNVRDPLPPLDTNLPLIAVMNFFKRDMWLMMKTMARLPEAASVLRLRLVPCDRPPRGVSQRCRPEGGDCRGTTARR